MAKGGLFREIDNRGSGEGECDEGGIDEGGIDEGRS